ncbi:antibiotic biosynthesis monooxygenase family protein [Kutzneria sp. NPDC052558]|uniref:antibiotic biosynthesis monooxygenase family protein n=1 Tax=Kutzneria sp. NPDC052558 TaxID=3364121 RepID=UPI0037C547B8
MAGVVFINCFEVPVGREEAFLELWEQVDSHMRQHPGFQWRRLHRSLDDNARLRFVNVAGWDSAEQSDAAHDEHFRELVANPAWREFPSSPSLYSVTREDHA